MAKKIRERELDKWSLAGQAIRNTAIWGISCAALLEFFFKNEHWLWITITVVATMIVSSCRIIPTGKVGDLTCFTKYYGTVDHGFVLLPIYIPVVWFNRLYLCKLRTRFPGEPIGAPEEAPQAESNFMHVDTRKTKTEIRANTDLKGLAAVKAAAYAKKTLSNSEDRSHFILLGWIIVFASHGYLMWTHIRDTINETLHSTVSVYELVVTERYQAITTKNGEMFRISPEGTVVEIDGIAYHPYRGKPVVDGIVNPSYAARNSCHFIVAGKELELASDTPPRYAINVEKRVQIYDEKTGYLNETPWQQFMQHLTDHRVRYRDSYIYVLRIKAMAKDSIPKKYPVGMVCY